MLLILDAVKMEGPDESDESSKESKESEIYHWDAGLPYGPDDFPKRGDKWGWSVGKRVGVSGNFLDRFLHLPHRLHNKSWVGPTSITRFANKPSIERFCWKSFLGRISTPSLLPSLGTFQLQILKGLNEPIQEEQLNRSPFNLFVKLEEQI